MKEKTSIVLLTSNRKDFSRQTIDGFYERLTNTHFIHLIVIDNNSKDGTVEMLKGYEKEGKIHKLILLGDGETVNISNAYNLGLKYVESELFITAQDDVIIPKLEPDVVEQLISLVERYPDHGGIGVRIQRIPNMKWVDGDLTPARKALSAYFRIQRKSDMLEVGGFGNRYWDDAAFVKQVREKLGKKCSWANNLWGNHLGHTLKLGYPEGFVRVWGSDKRHALTELEMKRKPYPQIDPVTNVPLPGQRLYR